MQNKKFRDKNFLSQASSTELKAYTAVLHTACGFDCEITKECRSLEEFKEFILRLSNLMIMNALCR